MADFNIAGSEFKAAVEIANPCTFNCDMVIIEKDKGELDVQDFYIATNEEQEQA